jgi:SAM-dependent methyltransferase
MLRIAETDIRRHGPGHILAAFWRQWRTERSLVRRGICFRSTDSACVATAYAAMSATEFDDINGPQDWANWRTIPRALRGHVPDRPLRVLDLGCGTGTSTRVLACFCPAGSQITGYEFAEPLVAIARRREYRRRNGQPAQVDFVCQSVTETLLQADGVTVPEQSVDLVNASGVVGHHLNAESIRPLVRELCRVLKPDGVAMLDVGPTLSASALRSILEPAGFAVQGRSYSWFGDTRGELVFRRKKS